MPEVFEDHWIRPEADIFLQVPDSKYFRLVHSLVSMRLFSNVTVTPVFPWTVETKVSRFVL